MDDEIKRTLQELAEGMRQLGESFGTQSKYYNEQYEKDKKFSEWQEGDRRAQRQARREMQADELKKLGYYKDEFGIIKQSTDLRKIENQEKQKAIKQIKESVGEEAFLRQQQQKFINDEIANLKESSMAYGGMVRSIADLNQAQREQLVGARKQAAEEEKRAQRAEKAAKAMEAPGQAIRGYTTEHGKQLDSLNSIIGTGKDNLYDMAKGSKLATGGMVLLEGAAMLLQAAFMGAAQASLAMGKSLINGERGMAVGAKGVSVFTRELNKGVQAFSTLLISVGSAAVAIGLLGGPIGWLGMALGGAAVAVGAVAKVAGNAAETLAELNEIAAQLNDKLFAGFNELGKMSMTASGGMEDIADKLHKMGLTVAEFDKFKTVVAANAKEMKMFGASMADGLTKFTDVSASLYESETSKMFQRMGITLEEQYEHTAKYMALQARLGAMEEKNAARLAIKTGEYIEELDKIAAITGASRKEQETAREAVMKIEQLRAAILDEQRKKEAGDTGADARIARLQRGMDMATTFQQMGDASAAKGAAEYVSGGITSEDAAKVAMMLNRQGLKQALDTGNMSKEQMDIATRRAYVEQTERASGAMRYGANVGPLAGSAVVAGEQKAIMAEFAKREAAEKKRLGDKYNQQELIDTIAKERKAADPTTNANIELQNNQRKTAISLDNAALEFTKAVGINKTASDTFSKAVDSFDKWRKDKTGESSTGSGAPKLTQAQVKEQTAKIDAEIERFSKKNDMKYKDNQAYVETLKKKKADIVAQGGGGQAATSGAAPTAKSTPASAPASTGGAAASPSSTSTDTSKAADALRLIGFQGDSLGNKQHFDALDDAVRENFTKMIGEYGKPVQINAAYRSEQEQQKMYDEAKPGADGKRYNKFGNPVAPPGGSKHNFGRAIDLNSDQVDALDTMGLLRKYGFSRVTGDRPHIEMARTGGVFDGPSSGYPVMLHGKEAVVPQANFKDIKKESLTSQAVSTSQTSDEVVELLAEMVETMSEKLDEVINKLGDGNDIQGKILNYSMA